LNLGDSQKLFAKEFVRFGYHQAKNLVKLFLGYRLTTPSLGSMRLSECYRILKRGGGLFITVPFMWHVHEAPHDYYPT